MNRANELQALLDCLEQTDFLGDTVDLTIRFDRHGNQSAAIEVAESFVFTHGEKYVITSAESLGLAAAWYTAWIPDMNEFANAIILEDDILLAPTWYAWLKRAWEAYGDRRDLAGISLMRQVLIPAVPHRQHELVNDHKPFLFSLVGSIAFSPHPAVWNEFISWVTSIERSFDVTTPGLVTSDWWNILDKRHMWTQHFIYFTLCRDLYTLYINVRDQKTIASHVRAKGEHYDRSYGPDFALATRIDFDYPLKLMRFSWDGSIVQQESSGDMSLEIMRNTFFYAMNQISRRRGFCYVLFVGEKSQMKVPMIIAKLDPLEQNDSVVVSSSIVLNRKILLMHPLMKTFCLKSSAIRTLSHIRDEFIKCHIDTPIDMELSSFPNWGELRLKCERGS